MHRRFWYILKLALLWCIPPAASYRFKLYGDADTALDHVYDHETHAYHAWRSHDLGFTAASRGLLQDKARFAVLMTEHGISVVPTRTHVARDVTGPAPLLECLEKHPRVFCKMNSGNQGRGAFTVWHTQNGLAGRI